MEETLQRLHLNPTPAWATSPAAPKARGPGPGAGGPAHVLLLDEPTNHLDLESIEWVEDLLIAFKGSVVTITHDRAFLGPHCHAHRGAGPGELRSYPGNFAAYRSKRKSSWQQEAVINAKADKLLAQEEVWMRKGVEARRTRSHSRIERLKAARQPRSPARDPGQREDGARHLADSSYQGKIVAELSDVLSNLAIKSSSSGFSGTILRGDKVGLLGANGAGKTTLLKMILGELAPDSRASAPGQQPAGGLL